MKVYVGPPVVSREFGDFDVGITFDAEPLGEKKWFIFSREGAFLQHCTCEKKGRIWRLPRNFDEFFVEIGKTKVAILYSKELRMRKLLRKIRDYKVDMILGYIEMKNYGSHLLLANGWGVAQITEAPTLLISHMKEDRAAYSLFKREEFPGNGIEFLYERYFFFEVESKRRFDRNTKWNHGIRDDKG